MDDHGSRAVIQAISQLGIDFGKKVDNLGETVTRKVDKMDDMVADLRTVVSAVEAQTKVHGHEIRDLKFSSNSNRERIDHTAVSITTAIREHHIECERLRDKLHERSRPLNLAQSTIQSAQGGALQALKPIIPYLIAAIISAILGSGATIVITKDDKPAEILNTHQESKP